MRTKGTHVKRIDKKGKPSSSRAGKKHPVHLSEKSLPVVAANQSTLNILPTLPGYFSNPNRMRS
jgi:hypothetical protein